MIARWAGEIEGYAQKRFRAARRLARNHGSGMRPPRARAIRHELRTNGGRKLQRGMNADTRDGETMRGLADEEHTPHGECGSACAGRNGTTPALDTGILEIAQCAHASSSAAR